MKLAVIPARGGSKRVPRKNVRPFAGRPMILHALAAVKASGLFDRIIVSTEDEEIARIATAGGAEAPFVRPAALADDHSGTIDVIAHAARWAAEAGLAAESICCVYATAAFLAPEDLRRGDAAMRDPRADFAFSVARFESPVQRSFRALPEVGVAMLFPEEFRTRSQDLPEALRDAGQFYFGRPEAWLEGGPIFGPRSAPILIPRWRAVDIDTEEDWRLAELLFAATAARGDPGAA